MCREPQNQTYVAAINATKTNAKAMEVNEGVKRGYSSCSDENVELEDVDAEAKVELPCKLNVDIDVDCPGMTGPTACEQAIIILFI